MVEIHSKSRTYLVITFLLLGVQKETAQFLVGPNVGLNWGALTIENIRGSLSVNSTLESSFGAIIEFPLNPIISLRVEPSYTQTGSDVYFNDMGGPTILKHRNQYVQAPILLQASLPLPVISPHLLLGPNIGYLLWANMGSNRNSQLFDIKDDFNNFDFGVIIGAGLEYRIAPLIKANLDYNYSMGLLNIDKTNHLPTHTRGIQVFASILFSI